MSVCFNEHTKKCASTQQTTSSKVLMMSRQWGIYRRSPSKSTNITLTETPRGISFCPSSNNTPSSPPSRVGSKMKALPEENI